MITGIDSTADSKVTTYHKENNFVMPFQLECVQPKKKKV